MKIRALTSLLVEGAWSLPALISFTSGANVPGSSDEAGRNVVLQQRNKSGLQPECGQHMRYRPTLYSQFLCGPVRMCDVNSAAANKNEDDRNSFVLSGRRMQNGGS